MELIDSLFAVQKQCEESQPALATASSSETQASRNADEDDEAMAEPSETSEGQTGDPTYQAEDDGDAIVEPSRATKRQRDDPTRQAEGDNGAIVEPSRTTKRQRKNANVVEKTPRTNMRHLARPKDPSSVSIKPEPSSDVKKENLYNLGPLMTAYSVFAYLINFTTSVPKDGPLAMNVATLPKQMLMTRLINDTVRNYARSRTNQFLTDAPTESSDKQQETIVPVDLDQDLLKEPTDVTQATTLQQSLDRISQLWKQRRSMVVHQEILESWAINIIYNAAGLQLEERPNRSAQTEIKRAVLDLLPVMRPGHMQGSSDQTILRTQYYWKLLAEFRSNGIPFIVAYRPSTVDTALMADGANRLRGADIPAWVPIVQMVEQHIYIWLV